MPEGKDLTEVAVAAFQALSLTIIGLMTWWVAHQQKKINRQQLEVNEHRIRLDLYDRRWAVYEATERFMDQVIRNLSPEFEDFSEFGRSTRHAKYLFENDVNTYLDELRKRAALLRQWSTEYDRHVEGKPVSHSPNEVVEGKNREAQWFAEQWESGEVARRFAVYLDVSQIGLG